MRQNGTSISAAHSLSSPSSTAVLEEPSSSGSCSGVATATTKMTRSTNGTAAAVAPVDSISMPDATPANPQPERSSSFDGEENEAAIPSYRKNLYLYSEQSGSVLLPNVIHSLVTKSIRAGVRTKGIGESRKDDVDSNVSSTCRSMGTLDGVYLPCLQNILGVMFFIRLSWVVGTAGTFYGFLVVFLCCAVTMVTAISMSAIATNGIVPSGGSYFMISRSLGSEFGGAVGILFYIGNTLVASMFIVGAIEILITYIAPGITLFGDTKVQSNMYNNYRVYGSILLYMIGTLVYFGIKFVNKIAGVALLGVLISILSVFIGVFVNMYGNNDLELCVLGNRLLGEVDNCTKTPGSTLWKLYCRPRGEANAYFEGWDLDSISNSIGNNRTIEYPPTKEICDSYFLKHEVKLIPGIRGLASGVLYENLEPAFMSKGQLISTTFADEDIFPTTNRTINGTTQPDYYNQVSVDITTTFTILVGIFFPSVTGVLAGCNHSGELKDPQKSIPIGTIGAILTTTIIYVVFVFLLTGSIDNLLLRDKFGQSIGGGLVVAKLAWPNEWVVLVGALLSSIGAGLQCLAAAPKLLQAIAKDNIIPFLHPFSVCSSSGEPTRALLLTLVFCQAGVLLGNVDDLAPLLSKFFLMCHQFVNLACAVQTILKTPNWRPRFRYYHWLVSIIGLVLSVTVMFMTSWYYAVLALVLAACIYKYIEYVGAENEWGDGIGGLALSAARISLLHLEAGPVATKNWRPQILILVKPTRELAPGEKKMFSFVSQLKAGKGLTMAVSVLEGDFHNRIGDVALAKSELTKTIHEEKVQGFCDVLVASDIRSGISSLIQVSGLGGLKPNTVLLGWSSNWRDRSDEGVFLRTVHQVSAAKMALLVPKGIHLFPNSFEEARGTIDVWWIIHEGGLLMLLPFLLKQHRTWRNCKMRIFTVAQVEDNSVAMKKDLELFLYALRIDAEVQIVEMLNSDISDYTRERTMRMEIRNELIKDFQSRDYRVAIKRMRSVAKELATSDRNVQDKLHQIQVIMESHTRQANDATTDENVNAVNSVTVQMPMPSHEVPDQEARPNASSDETHTTQLPPQPPVQADGTILNHVRPASMEGPQAHSVEIGDQDLDFIALEMFAKNHRNREKYWRNTLTIKGHEENVRRMHTAVKLNEAILSKSYEAALVIIKMPVPPLPINAEMEANYLEYLEAMTEGLRCVLMVRGGGREFLTIFS